MESSSKKNNTNPIVNPVPLLDVGRGNKPLLPEIMQKLQEICESGWFIGGPHCKELESVVAEACDTNFAIGCASGSDSLLLSLMAIDLQPGQEVIVPSFTFFASVSAITRLGGVPVLVDIEPGTFNMNAQLIADLITERTVAIMPVHLFGQCADMLTINRIAREHGLRVIEDTAQAIGATFNGQMAGSIGDFGCISFYPTKNIGGFGDAGMITTNDAKLADRVRLLANHGMRPRYYHSEVGINSRLDAMQAAVLTVKMQQMSRYSAMRARNASTYNKLMVANGLGGDVVLPEMDKRCGHVWNQYTIRIPGGRRDEIRQSLQERGVGTEIYYPIPMHRQECFIKLGLGNYELPETEKAVGEVLSLPIFPELTTQEIETVVGHLKECLYRGQGRLNMAA